MLRKIRVPHPVALEAGVHILNDLQIGSSAGEVEVDELNCVRRNWQVEGVSDVRHLHPLRNAPYPSHVGLHYVRPAGCNEVTKAMLGIFMLARGDWNVNRAANFCQSVDVVRNQRLLEPAHLVLLELPRHIDGLLGIVSVVGVDVDGGTSSPRAFLTAASR